MIFAIREQSTLHAVCAFAALVCAFAAVLTAAIMFFCPTNPRNAYRIQHCSLEESKKRVKESAALIRYCEFPSSKLPHRTYDRQELLNSAIDLAHTGDPDAEYLIGWMYQHEVTDADGVWVWLNDVSGEVNRAKRLGFAVNWYRQAAAHGSAQAANGIASCKLFYGASPSELEDFRWCQKAVAHGDIEAKIDLGMRYEHGEGTKTDLRKAMELYEQATKAEDEVTVTRAIACMLNLWVQKHVIPSSKFAMGATDPFDFLSRFDDGGMDAKKYVEKFSYCGFSPDPYAQYRWDLFAKVRHALGLFSYPASGNS